MNLIRPEERILVASGQRDDLFRIREGVHWLPEDSVEWVQSSDEARERLDDPGHPFALVLVDREIAPGPAPMLFNHLRRDPASPYPGLAIALIGTEVTEVDVRRATQAGCVFTLSRPFSLPAIAAAVQRWPLDRADFLVGGAYVGPERRRAGERPPGERRSTAPTEQSIASTARLYDIAPETTAFRFKRFPAGSSGNSAALRLRNGLTRATVNPAFAHIAVKKREGLGALVRQAGAMGETWRQLQATLAPGALTRLNRQAVQSYELSSQRGLLLLAAITGSLARYSAGRHGLGPRLVGFLRAHLDGVSAALRHRIDDDGGPVGRNIMSTLKDAERLFTGPKDETPGEPDFAVTVRMAGRA
ncbi:MAG: hypothetical protein RLO51_12015 [Thalassobaculum sp.]|uniref:hypothetical protein n=1 Tax=Thalassobaculum sp. TaxID=2022740 RepID=UPI0032ECB952